MYLFYLDESGTLQDKKQEHFVLAGISIFERQVHYLRKKVDSLAQQVANRFEFPHADIEFHSSPMLSGRNYWRKIKSKEVRLGLVKEVLKIVAESHDSVRIYACVVHKKSFSQNDPMELAFEDLISRFDAQIDRINRDSGESHRSLMILDKTSYEISLQRLGNVYRRDGTQWRSIKNLVDVPMFVDSKSSRLIQLADTVAYAIFRCYEHNDKSLFDIIDHKFDAEGSRLHGLTHKHKLSQPCLCPSCYKDVEPKAVTKARTTHRNLSKPARKVKLKAAFRPKKQS